VFNLNSLFKVKIAYMCKNCVETERILNFFLCRVFIDDFHFLNTQQKTTLASRIPYVLLGSVYTTQALPINPLLKQYVHVCPNDTQLIFSNDSITTVNQYLEAMKQDCLRMDILLTTHQQETVISSMLSKMVNVDLSDVEAGLRFPFASPNPEFCWKVVSINVLLFTQRGQISEIVSLKMQYAKFSNFYR